MCCFWKKISLENLTYWNVEEQEAYFSYIEAAIKREKNKLFPPIMRPYPLIGIFTYHFF